MDRAGLGWQTSSSREDSTVLDNSVVFSLFQHVLFFLLSLISTENFPLEALGLLPPLQRRMVFLRLPVVDLYRLERCSPSATKGINMSKVWKEIFSERLCPQAKFLTQPMTFKLEIFGGGDCMLRNKQTPNILDRVEVRRVLFAVPLQEDVRRIGEFEQIKCKTCYTYCRNCKRYKFYCSLKYLHVFHDCLYSTLHNEFDQSFLEAVMIILDIFPIEVDRLSVTGIPALDITETRFHCLLYHIHTFEIQLCQSFSKDPFLEDLLKVLVSNPLSPLQNLHLSMCSHRSHLRYGAVVSTITPFFSPVSTNQDIVPFLNLISLKIVANFSKFKSEIKKLVTIINGQEQLQSLMISSETTRRTRQCFSAHQEIFQVMLSCFLKPTLQCLTLHNLHMSASALFDIEYHFLISTACRKQQLVLQGLRVDSFDKENWDITYASESASCTKSLSVIGGSMEDVGLFSAADIASPILLYPGSQEVKLLHCLDRVDLYKLPAALEKGIGTLKLLDLSGCNLSSITARANLLLDAIFHLPHLSELELVLRGCCLQEEDLDHFYCEWEKARSRIRRSRARKLRCLKKLCVCENDLPEDIGNLEVMANTLCYNEEHLQ